MHGKGEFLWPNGMVYRGGYKDGLREGYGVLSYPDGKQFEGYWEKGREDGFGTERLDGIEVRQGIWRKGQFFKQSGSEKAALTPLLLRATTVKLKKDEMPRFL